MLCPSATLPPYNFAPLPLYPPATLPLCYPATLPVASFRNEFYNRSMKFFLSYRFTGEDPVKLKPILESIQKALEARGHTNYCTFEWQSHFRDKKLSNREILHHAFAELLGADVLLAFINSPEKSEGMLLEIGYALGKGKKVYVLIRRGVETVFVRAIADRAIEFDKVDEIPALISYL